MKMNMLKTLLLIICTFVFPLQIYAGIQIKDIQYEKISEQMGQIKVAYTGELINEKSITYSKREDLVQMEISEASVWPKIEKKVEWDNDVIGAQLLAYQFDKNLVRIRLVFPNKLNTLSNNLLNLSITPGIILFHFPISSLEIESKEKFVLDEVVEVEKKPTQAVIHTKEMTPKIIPIKKTNNMNEYILKITIFTSGVLILFFLIVHIFKKGVMKRGKLAFLKNENLVTIIGQNYLSPKRSLITVKVMDQVFLLANCENGLSFLSELHSVSNVLKHSEKAATGKNFDDSLDNNLEKEFNEFNIKEKEDILKSVGDKVSLGSQLKEKIKKLKPLQ